jgi:hypothetical protein
MQILHAVVGEGRGQKKKKQQWGRLTLPKTWQATFMVLQGRAMSGYWWKHRLRRGE